jgi:hypothetical protein
MVWNMVKFVILLILLGLIVAPANCRIPKIGDNVTIVVGFNQSFSGIIRNIPTNFICIEDIVLSTTLDYCIGTVTIQYLMWNDQQNILANKILQEASNTSGSENGHAAVLKMWENVAEDVGTH